MSILNDILNGVGQTLTEAIGDNGMNILMTLQDPDGFDSREELSDVMDSVFGDDLTSLFDRRALATTLQHERKVADDSACKAMVDDEGRLVSRALEVFNEVRDDILDVAMHETLRSEFGEGVRDRSLININSAIRASATGEDVEADEGLIPDDDDMDDDPPLTDDLDGEDQDEDDIEITGDDE